MPIRNVEEIIQMIRHSGLPTTRSFQYRHKYELLRRRLYGSPCKEATGAQQLEGLDLDDNGGAVEVLCEDDVGDLGGGEGCDGASLLGGCSSSSAKVGVGSGGAVRRVGAVDVGGLGDEESGSKVLEGR